MQYRLYNSKKKSNDIQKQVLYNRGIEDVETYLNLNSSVVEDYNLLDNINETVTLFDSHYQKKNCIGIIPDSDVDGQCSSAELFLYIKRMDKDYPIKIIYHTKPKAHGLSDVKIPDDVKLLIVADAGTNDTKECKELRDRGVDIIVLDHHEKEENNPYAIIVNNQCSSKYSNKQLCGGGIVYRWLQALDDYYWNEFADDYLDLVAFSNISDVMDMRKFETRYFVNCGLSNINNKFIKTLIQAQDYSMNGKINIHNIQWYLTPFVNALLRMGTQEEKEILFRAFIEQDEYFEYKKRATKDSPAEIVQESIYERAVRLCKNAKSRQDKQKEKGVLQIKKIAEQSSKDDKVVMIDVSDVLDGNLTGVIAIKIAEMFNKPCVLLKKYLDEKSGIIVYGGSARNISNSPIDSFKDVVNSTDILCGIGHPNAFGIVNFPINKKDEALEKLNYILRDVKYDSTYNVDFIFDINDVSLKIITDLTKLEDIIGQGIEEPMVAVENIYLNKNQFKIFGKNEDTIIFMVNDIKYIQFKCQEGNQLYDWLQDAWDNNNDILFNIVGKPTISEYKGVKTPQIIIEDVSVVDTNNDLEYEEW